MYKTVLSLGLAISVNGMVSAECPIVTGETVEMQSYEETFFSLPSGNIEKGEFETTAEFNSRIASMQSSESMIVEGYANDYYLKYEADDGRFVFSRKFFDYDADWVFMKNAIPEELLNGVRRPFDGQVTGVKLNPETFTKSKSGFVYHLIFDEVHSKSFRGDSDKSLEWEFDKKSYRMEGSSRKEQVSFLSMPIEQARSLKDGIRVGFAITPKPPYSSDHSETRTSDPSVSVTKRGSGEHTRYEAYYSDGGSLSLESSIIFADINCAFVADESGKVLKIIPRR